VLALFGVFLEVGMRTGVPAAHYLFFYEHFHGENRAGLGASHQTG